MAAATVVSGLAFGPAAVQAAPAPSSATSSDNSVNDHGMTAVDLGPQTLVRGATSDVAFAVQRVDAIGLLSGSKITLTAPAGTTFPAQSTAVGQYMTPSQLGWSTDFAYSLKDGTVTNGGRNLEFTTRGSVLGVGTKLRWTVKLNVSASAPASGQLAYRVLNTASNGYDLSAKAGFDVKVDQVEARAESVNHDARTANLVGRATPYSRIEVGNRSTTANSWGDWSMTVTGLAQGAQNLVVIQKVLDREVNRTSVAVTIVVGGTMLPDVTPPVALTRGATVEVPFTVKNDQLRDSARGQVVLTAPAGTTFAPGQNSIIANTRTGAGEGDWLTNDYQSLVGPKLTDGNRTLTLSLTTSKKVYFLKDLRYRWKIKVNVPLDAPGISSGMGYMFTGTSDVGDFSAQGATATTLAEAPLTADVDSVDNVARTAEISGTSLPGARIDVNGQNRYASTAGKWSMTVADLRVGEQTLPVVQSVNGVEINRTEVTITVLEGGGILPGSVPNVALERGSATDVPFVVKNTVDRKDMVGDVELTAPAGTTFAPGQTTVAAQYRAGDDGDWKDYARLDLKGAAVSNGGRTIKGKIDGTGGDMRAGEQYRYVLKVDTPAGATTGRGQMQFDYTGTSSVGNYRAQGGTATTITAAALTAEVGIVNNITRTAMLSGTGVSGAEIDVNGQTATVQSDGKWSRKVSGLVNGPQRLAVVQKVKGAEVNRTEVDVTIVEGGTVVPGSAPKATLERGATTDVPFIVKNEEDRSRMDGTVELTAPAGTTFAKGTTTVAAQYRVGDSGAWSRYAPLDLTNGRLSDNDTTLKFDMDTGNARMVKGEQYRYLVKVATPAAAPAADGTMGYVYAGDSSKGDYRARGVTDTVIADASDVITGQTGPAATLVRGGDAEVEARFTLGTDITRPTSRIEFTAPAGTTFPAGQDTITGGFKAPGSDSWDGGGMQLTNGERSADGTKYTFDFNGVSYMGNVADTVYRWKIKVATPDDATAGPQVMQTHLSGRTAQGTFDATSITPATIPEPAGTKLEAKVDSVDHAARTATLSGTATKGATVSVGSQSVEVTADDGSWSMTVRNLEIGTNTLHVVQTIDGKEFDTQDLEAVIGINLDFRVTTPEADSEHRNEIVLFAGEGRAGEKVTISVTNFDSVDVTAVVDPTGHWKVDRFIGGGPYVFDVVQQNAAGATTGEMRGLMLNTPVDEDPVNLPWAVTTPTNGSEHRGEIVSWSGTGSAGQTVEIDPKNPELATVKTEVDKTGHWQVNRYIGEGSYNFDVVQKNGSAITGATRNILINQDVNLEFAVTTPTAGSDQSARMVTFEGTGRAHEQVTLHVTNFEAGDVTARVGSNGHWSVKRYLGDGPYAFDITQKNLRTGATTGTVKDFRLNQPAVGADKPFSVTSPTTGSTFAPDTSVLFRGTGKVNARVVVSPGAGLAPVTTTVDGNGEWSVSKYLGNGPYTFTVTMTPVDGEAEVSAPISLTPTR
ncbi:hypothetical protein [Curtobacterium sp. RRHDQ10]|uniref:hypothetical protein n=1 Tax=Curtobacterium phyllosphaerae TaxID=3413379 RepID=UPI003BF0DA19